MAEKTKYTDAEIEEFRLIIVEKKQEAERLAKEFKQEADDIILSPVGFKTIEEASEAASKKELIDKHVKQLAFASSLNFALMRIDNEHYGHCRDCGKLIPKERLRVAPHSTQCCDCKNLN